MPSPTLLLVGAHSDIGRAVAHRFAREGFRIVLAARNPERLAADVSDLKLRYEIEVQALGLDVLQTEAHASFYAALAPQPDVVCMMVGLLGDHAVAESNPAQAELLFHSNYTGPSLFLLEAARNMALRGSGCIIGVSSVAGDRGRGSNYLYGSAKAGFTAFLSGLRNRYFSSGVHVLTVKPGFVYTSMTEGLTLPSALTASAAEVAEDIYRAYLKRKNVIYSRWMWKWIMTIIRSIPEPVFKKLKL